MREPLSSELIREWRAASAECPQPISLDRMVIELADEVLHLRTQRDQLHEANNRLLEERRAARAEVADAVHARKNAEDTARAMTARAEAAEGARDEAREALRGLRWPRYGQELDRYCDHAAEPCPRCEAARRVLAGRDAK